MLGLRFVTDAQARAKKGHPAHHTTGVAHASCSQFDAVRPITAGTRSPSSISPIARAKTGKPTRAAHRNRRVMSSSSGLAASGTTVRGSRAMPHFGHTPGPSCTTSGCIAHVYSTVGCRASAPSSGSRAMPHFGHTPGPSCRTPAHIGHENHVSAALSDGSSVAGGAAWPDPASRPEAGTR